MGDYIGLDTNATRNILQSMSSVGLLDRTGDGGGLMWKMKRYEDAVLILKTLEGKVGPTLTQNREVTPEDKDIDPDEIPF